MSNPITLEDEIDMDEMSCPHGFVDGCVCPICDFKEEDLI